MTGGILLLGVATVISELRRCTGLFVGTRLHAHHYRYGVRLGKDGRTRGRTNCAGSIGLGKFRSLLGELIKVRGFNDGMPMLGPDLPSPCHRSKDDKVRTDTFANEQSGSEQ